jgi:glycosyltransferase involved in cell wall biosynthesis
MSPSITICICTFDRYDLLPKAIESALTQSIDPSEFRVMVVDNSPDHKKAREFGQRYESNKRVSYRVEERPGLSNARNIGAQECGTEFIAFMDDDAIASSDWVTGLLAAFRTFGEDVAVVGGRVDPIWEATRPVWLSDALLGHVSVVNWGGEARIANKSEWFAGTNIAFRTSAIVSAGSFDVRLGRTGNGAALMSNEESVVVNHLRALGKLAVYAPAASVRHLVERKRTTQVWYRKRVAWQAVSDFIVDPAASHEMSIKGWDWVMKYFFSLPPKERNIRGMHLDTDSPDLFKWQLEIIYLHTQMLLNGFQGTNDLELALTKGENHAQKKIQ